MGIPIHLTLVGVGQERADQATAAAKIVFDIWDKRCSRFRDDSELAHLNRNAGKAVVVSQELFDVIATCVQLSQETNGVFDPSIGAYLAAAGYGLPAGYVLPKKVPTWQDIVLDPAKKTVRCAPGQVLEPAAIVKGLAIDQAGEKIAALCESWMINAGGDILTHGPFGEQGTWNIAIQHPQNAAAVATAIAVRDCSVATSGTYQTTWEWQGEFWQHQIEAQTKKPTKGVKSLTVVASDATKADTFASIGLLLGIEQGQKYLRERLVPYMYIDDQLQIHKNKLFEDLERPLYEIVG